MPENPTPSGLLQPDAANNGNAGAGAIDALSLFRRLSSATVATSFQPSQRDQFGGQIYNRSNTNLANLATQLGYSAIGSGNRSTAVGSFAYAREDSAVALGVYALALGPSSVAIGDQALSSGYRSITIGNQGQGNALGAISIGFQARALGVNSIAIGSQAYAIGANAISIGASARTVAAYSIALGALASVPVSNSPGALAIGANANVTGAFGAAIALGAGATVLGTLSPAIAIGSNATVTSPGREGIAIGTNALVSARAAQAYGEATTASFMDSVAFGRATITTSTNQMMVGNPTYPLSVNISGPRPWVDVMAYGAMGDGTTNDTVFIQNAITAGAGGRVLFPATSSYYKITAALTVPDNTEIVLFNARIQQTTATVAIFDLALSGNATDITIRGMGPGSILESTNTAGTGWTSAAYGQFGLINASGSNTITNLTVTGLTVRYTYSCAVIGGNNANVNTVLSDCVIYRTANFAVGAAGSMKIRNNKITYSHYAAIDGGYYGGTEITGNELAFNGGGAEDIDSWCGVVMNSFNPITPNADKIVIANNYVHDNLAYGIYVGLGSGTAIANISQKIIIANNLVVDQGTDNGSRSKPCGIYVVTSKGVIVENNICSGNYDGVRVSPEENSVTTVYAGAVTGLMVNGNTSLNSVRSGFRWESRTSGVTGAATSNTFIGCGFHNNRSINDTAAFVYPTYNNIDRSGNVAISGTETLGLELVVNGGFESGSPPSNWTALNGATLSRVADPVTGSYAMDVLRGASNQAAQSDNFSLTAGQLYKVSMYGRFISGTVPQAIIETSGSVEELALLPADSSSYVQRIGYMIAQTTGTYRVQLRLNGGGAEAHYDDISVKAVTNQPVEDAATSGPLTVTGTLIINGNLTAANLYSSTYTPSLTNTTNVTTSTANVTGYARNGDVVIVFGKAAVDPTAAGITNLDVTVPISSAFTQDYQAASSGTYYRTIGYPVQVKALTTDKVRMTWDAPDGTASDVFFHFSYLIV